MFYSGWALIAFPPIAEFVISFMLWNISKTKGAFSIVETKQASLLSEPQKCPTVRKNVFCWLLALLIPMQPFLLAPFSRRTPGAVWWK